jgi:hypothetical protein
VQFQGNSTDRPRFSVDSYIQRQTRIFPNRQFQFRDGESRFQPVMIVVPEQVRRQAAAIGGLQMIVSLLHDAASNFDEQSLQFGLKVERGGSRNGLRAKLLYEPADP